MEFGKVETSQLDEIDYRLPVDPPATIDFLETLPHCETKVYVGCAKWGMKEWVGKIYPADAKEKQFLELYASYFNSLELDSTFYNMQRRNIESWAGKMRGKDVKVCPKFNRKISHARNFDEAADMTAYFTDAIRAFGDNLGVTFLQFPDYFAPKRMKDLEGLLQTLPHDFAAAVELRNKGWFENGPHEVFDLLQSLNKGAVITDTAGRRDCIHLRITAPKMLIRFVGNNLHPTDFVRIDCWALKLKEWISGGKLEEVYFFVHNDDEAFSPYTARYAIDKFNEVCGLNLKPLQIMG